MTICLQPSDLDLSYPLTQENSGVRTWRNWYQRGIERNRTREGLRVYSPETSDEGAFPGEPVSRERISYTKQFVESVLLIDAMVRQGVALNSDNRGTITPTTARATFLFLVLLRNTAPLPKMSVDGEGGLMLIWDKPDGITLLTVDGWCLHLVQRATTPTAEYSAPLEFNGKEIPREVLRAII